MTEKRRRRQPTRTRNSDSQTRERLAFWVTGICAGGIAVASIVAIWLADDMRPEMARLVFASVVPLFGTWVGTVLAFYFARENLQAATDSTVRLAGLSEPDTPVSEVMIPRATMHTFELLSGQDAGAVTLAELRSKMAERALRRMPILKSDGCVAHVMHESTISLFAAHKNKQPSEFTTETVADLLAVQELAALVNAIGFVASDADLGDARAAMRSVKGCNDVFVTQRGRSEEAVIGWLTNTELAGLE